MTFKGSPPLVAPRRVGILLSMHRAACITVKGVRAPHRNIVICKCCHFSCVQQVIKLLLLCLSYQAGLFKCNDCVINLCILHFNLCSA